jgi:putative membrane protein
VVERTLGKGEVGSSILPSSTITALVMAAIALLALALTTLGSWLSWRRLRYCVGQADIRVEKGLVSRSARSVPYERIQDVSLEQALLPRLLGLVEVKFETGAGGGEELKLAYVTTGEGARLRDVVREQREGGTPAALPAAAADARAGMAAEPEGRLLFAMGPRRLFLFGLFEFSLVLFAVLAGAAQQLEFLLPFDLWDPDQWDRSLATSGVSWGAWLAGLGWAAQIVGAALALGALVGVGLLTGVVRTMLREWDFRLELTSRGFRRRRGLFTRTDVVMPAHRVQGIAITTGIVRRIWGWHSLAFISLAQDAKSENHVVAPFAQMDELVPLVAAAGFSLPDEGTAWQRPSRRYFIDRALIRGGGLGIGAVLALPFQPLVSAVLLSVGLALAGLQWLAWRFEEHAVDLQRLYSRRGALAPRLAAIDRIKVHSVELVQGPLARRGGYATVEFGIGGTRFGFPGLPLEQARAMRLAVLDSISAVDFSRLPR